MARLRILFVIDHIIDAGGAERFAVGLATHLPQERFELTMCSTRSADPAVAAVLRTAGIGHLNLRRRGRLDVRRLVALARFIHRHRFDVLHAHMFGSNLWGTVIGRACRVPVVIAHEQTWSYEGEPVRRWLDGHVIGRLATRFVAVSTLDAERMVSVEGVPPDRVTIIPNAYVPHPASAPCELREELGLPPGTPLLATVGMLRPQKALSVLLDACALVFAHEPEAQLVLAGSGECREALEAQARRLDIAARVHFLGHRSDVDAILASADLAVMSSDYEGTPLVAFECIAAHTPLVATRVGGLPDIVEDGRTGRLVPRRDPAALAAAVLELLRDPCKRERIATSAATGLHAFTIEAAAGRFSALYEQLAAEAGVRTAPR